MSKKNLVEAALVGISLIGLIYGVLYFYFHIVLNSVVNAPVKQNFEEYKFKPVPVVDTTGTFSDVVDSTWTDNYNITYVSFK